MQCSIAQALEVVGDPWTLLIVRDLFFGYRRFDVLQERLGIPRTTLTDRLDRLVEHGVVERRPYQERPPRSEYWLTPKGLDLSPVLVTLMQWGDTHSGAAEPPVVLLEPGTGRRIEPVLVDRSTGRSLAELRPRPVPGPGADTATAPPA